MQAASDPDDLAGVAGGLIDETSCQQLVGGAKYRRVALAGIGTVRVRAYTTGPALRSSPLRLTTEITGGKAKRVSYQLDGRAIGAAKDARHSATLTPAQLGKVGVHTLTHRGARSPRRREDGRAHAPDPALPDPLHRAALAHDRGRRAAPARRLAHRADASCPSRCPARCCRRRRAKRRVAGFIRLYVGGQAKPLRYKLWLPKKGAAPRLLAAAGKPAVELPQGRPARHRAAAAHRGRRGHALPRDQARPPHVAARLRRERSHQREGATAAETLSAKPKAPR